MVRSLLFLAFVVGQALFAQEAPALAPEPAVTAPIAPAESAAPEAPTPVAPALPASIAIEIDLTEQKAWILQDGQRVYETPISSGRTGFETPAGEFKVLEKDADHKSSLYGKILDAKGRVLISDADTDMVVPAGARFTRAPMKHFLRFDGAVGMHAGRLPGYPASHGCVRLPPAKAALFFDIAELGMPVRVFGKAPRTGPAPKRNVAKAVPVATPLPATPKPRRFLWFLAR